jgi:hypothetical protein
MADSGSSLYLDIGNIVIILIVLGCSFYLYITFTDMQNKITNLEADYIRKYGSLSSTTSRTISSSTSASPAATEKSTSQTTTTTTITSTTGTVSTTLPTDIDKVPGFSSEKFENSADKNQTAEMCRQKALASDGKYVAWGYRNNDHPDATYKNTCFFYTNPFAPYSGNPDDKVHQIGCLRPGEKVSWGCKTQQ